MNKLAMSCFIASLTLGAPLQASAGGLFGFFEGNEEPKVLSESSYEEIQGVLSRFGEGMSDAESVDDYRALEKAFVKLVHEAYPNTKSYWNDLYTYGDMKVVQSDALIDLERIKVDKVILGARMEEYTSQKSPRKSDGAIYPVLMTSHVRMKSGLAPIGPDNQPVVLCRLHDDPRASYFEMSKHDAWRILNAVGSGMSTTQACMSESVVPGYWKEREKNLIDGRGNIVRSKRHAMD